MRSVDSWWNDDATGALLGMPRRGRSDRPPRIPCDVEDDERDREAHDRVGDRSAERDNGSAGDDAEADEAVNAGVVAVGDQSRAVEPPPGCVRI